MPAAITLYSVVLALHIMAVILAYGLPLAYPLALPYLRKAHPEAMPGVHDVQHRLNRLLTGPGTAFVLLFGIYLASKADAWSEPFVGVGLAIILLIGAVGGAVIVPASRRMAELSRADVEATPAGSRVTWGAEYEHLYRRYMTAELALGAAVLVAIFFMAAKPFS